jgi:predicted MFS family arabinose efflux permease
MGMCLSATSAVYAVAGLLLVLGAARWMRKGVGHQIAKS